MCLLTTYSRLMDGKILRKRELADEFGITQRSVQCDLEALRNSFSEEMMGRKIIYDTHKRGYQFSAVCSL